MIIAILQARCSSTRLPNKVMRPILGKPMLLCEIERIQRSQRIEKVVVATSLSPEDDALADVCRKHKIEYFRGSLDDVLDRYYQCAKQLRATHIVRVTGDCPLLDWNCMDAVIEKHLAKKNGYTSNTLVPTFPDGLDIEVIEFRALEIAWKEACLLSEREHVTPFLYKNPQRFHLGCLKNAEDLSSLRWTVDEQEDFVFVTKVYEELYNHKQDFTMQEVLNLLERKPQFREINQRFQRNEGFMRSLEMDQRKQMR